MIDSAMNSGHPAKNAGCPFTYGVLKRKARTACVWLRVSERVGRYVFGCLTKWYLSKKIPVEIYLIIILLKVIQTYGIISYFKCLPTGNRSKNVFPGKGPFFDEVIV